jgi:hypothetical protein
MWQALGTAVFSGMIGVTFFGIFLTPVFFRHHELFAPRHEGKTAVELSPTNRARWISGIWRSALTRDCKNNL